MATVNSDEETGNRLIQNKIAGFLNLVGTFNNQDPNYTASHFISQIETISNLAQWSSSEKLAVIKSKLKGVPNEILHNDATLSATEDYDEFKTCFLEYFERKIPKPILLKNYIECKMKPHESVKEYSLRLRKLAREYHGSICESEELKEHIDTTNKSVFLAGIKPNLQRAILTQNPKTFKDAIRLASEAEVNNLMLYQCNEIDPDQTFAISAEKKEVTEIKTEILESILQQLKLNEGIVASMKQKIERLEKEKETRADTPSPPQRNNSFTPPLYRNERFRGRNVHFTPNENENRRFLEPRRGVRPNFSESRNETGQLCFNCFSPNHFIRHCPRLRRNERTFERENRYEYQNQNLPSHSSNPQRNFQGNSQRGTRHY